MPEAKYIDVTTGRVRVAYPYLLTPRAPMNGQGEPHYSACILIPKTDEAGVKALKQAIVDCAKSRWGDNAVALIKAGRIRNPLRDGDAERPENEDFKGCYFFNGRAGRKPRLVDESTREISNPEDFTSGDYARVFLALFPYQKAGNTGVGVGINGVQRWGRGKAIQGGANIAFEKIELQPEDVDLSGKDAAEDDLI